MPPSARILAVCLLAAVIVGVSCDGGTSPTTARPQVVAGVYPLAYVAGEVAGDAADVHVLAAPGVEPHDLELTSEGLRRIADADLLVYVGGGFQPAVEDAAGEAGASLEVEPVGDDPHVWLDPLQLAELALQIEQRLADIDPEHAETYAANARSLQERLKRLDRSFSEGLARCERRDVVTAHAAFGILAARYDLRQTGITGVDPESEPSPSRVAEIAELVRSRGVTTIFTERLLSPRLAETVAAETDTEVALLDPLESEPPDGDYFDAMEENLEALKDALGCS